MRSIRLMLAAYLKVCRYEYFPAEIIALFIPFFLSANSFNLILKPLVLEGALTFIILYLSGFLINAWTDREVDAKYQTFKSSIAWGVRYLGEKKLKIIIMVHILISLLLGLHISYIMRSFFPIIIILVGIFFAFGYSIQPFSFKTRGVFFHIISLSLCCFFIPMIFFFYVVNGGLTWDFLVFAGGFSMVHYALEIGNQIQDYEEDLTEDLKTPVVRIGLKKSLGLSMVFFIIGLPTMAIILSYWFHMKGTLGQISPIPDTIFTIAFISTILMFGYYITFRGLFRMYMESMKEGSLQIIMKNVRSHINYARWQISGIAGLFSISLIYFINP